MILHVITSMRMGGAEKLLTQLLPRFKQSGADVELALFDGTDTPLLQTIADAGITIHRLGHGYRSMYDPRNIIRLQRLMRRGYDIVHTHNTTPQLFAALARRPHGTRLVTTEHNTTNRRRNHPILRPADRWMYRQYDSIVCCSDPVEAALHVALNDRAISQRIVTIPNGIDLTPYPSQPHACPSGSVNILMVAAFREQKDHLTPLRALTRLPETVTLTYAGDGVTRPQTEKEAHTLGVSDRVTFLGNVTDIPALYRDADLALLSTHYEGFGLAAVEAMASGSPLMVSDVPGVSEVVGDGAARFPLADADALARLIGHLSSDPALYTATAIRGMARAQQFDINITAKAYLKLYNVECGMSNCE